MKRALLVLFMSAFVFFAFAQQIDIQRINYNEENSALPTSVCYNWNQLNNGEFFVSGNAGIFLFDGVNFKHFTTQGRGTAISSSIEDNTGRLWCNSFHGDVFYMEHDSLLRHPISGSLRGLTFFQLVNDRLFLYTDTKLFEIDTKTLTVKLLKEFNLIRTLFESNNQPYVLSNTPNGKTNITNLTTMQSSIIEGFPFVHNSSCRFIQGEHASFLFFETDRKYIEVNEFMKGTSSKIYALSHQDKINYITLLDDQIAVCGMNGINLYSSSGKWQNQILSDIQVTHFGKDQEGNYIATSTTEGLILMPDLNVLRSDYTDYLHHEAIIQSTFDQQRFLYLGTNAGKILRHDLTTQQIDVIELGLRSEVLSLQLSNDRTQLYVYCDDLYILDAKSLSIQRKLKMSSVKEMALCKEGLILGTRKGIEIFNGSDIKALSDLGWVNSILSYEQRNELYIASKNGLFHYRLADDVTSPIHLKGIDDSGTFSDLTKGQNEVFFIYNHSIVYRCSEDFQEIKEIYRHSSKGLNGLSYQNDQLLLFAEDQILQLTSSGHLVEVLSGAKGLNESYTIDGFNYMGQLHFVHKKSLSVFNGSPKQSITRPEISFLINEKSTFRKTPEGYNSSYEDNELIFRLNIRRALHAPGQITVYYCFDLEEKNWKKLENPYSETRLERLPMGDGFVYFKAVNPSGISSEIISVPYYVEPPFYLSIWFIACTITALILLVMLIVKWRVQLTRKKNLARLEKERLESRLLHAELTAIRSQMNPHFIFNVLTAIQAKVIQQKIDEAYTNIGDFAILIRNVLEKSGKEYISLDEEIALMENYVELENSRLTQRISFEVKINDSEYFEEVFIPTLITQPLIENAIKHAFTTPQAQPKIILEAQSNSNGFTLTIKDNGTGFDSSSKHKDHQPFALSTLRKRIDVLSKTAPYIIALSLSTGEDGTQVEFSFNYKQK